MALIAMKRGMPMREGGPVTADVDESQVDEWRRVGWEIANPEPVDVQAIDFGSMTLAELRTLAKDSGVNVPAALKDKAKIVAALKPALDGNPGPLA